jgi:hypothetical protein
MGIGEEMYDGLMDDWLEHHCGECGEECEFCEQEERDEDEATNMWRRAWMKLREAKK